MACRKLLISLAVAITTSQFAFAKGTESHGGVGAVVGGKTYLLDFVESGIETNPIVASPAQLDQEIYNDVKSRVASVFSDITGFPSDLVAIKITEMWQLDPVAGASFLKAAEMLSWRVVDRPLMQTEDGKSILVLPGRVQLAVRNGQSIRFYNREVAKLPRSHYAGLAVHEIAYSLIRPDRVSGEPAVWVQSVERVREATAYLFSRDLTRKGRAGLYLALGGAGRDGLDWTWASGLPRDFGAHPGPFASNSVYVGMSAAKSERKNSLIYLVDSNHKAAPYSPVAGLVRETPTGIDYNPAVMIELSVYANGFKEFVQIPIYKVMTMDERRQQYAKVCGFNSRNATGVFSHFHESLGFEFAQMTLPNGGFSTYIRHNRSFTLSEPQCSDIPVSMFCDDNYSALDRWVDSFMPRSTGWK